jgi:hypothetical protein
MTIIPLGIINCSVVELLLQVFALVYVSYHQQTKVILCQIIFLPSYYTYYVTIIIYYVTIISIIFFRVFGLLCHIMSNFRKQLLFQLCQYCYFNFFFASIIPIKLILSLLFHLFLINCIMSLICFDMNHINYLFSHQLFLLYQLCYYYIHYF